MVPWAYPEMFVLYFPKVLLIFPTHDRTVHIAAVCGHSVACFDSDLPTFD